MKKNFISHFDAIELMQTLPDNCIDLLLTDIPYGRVNKKSGGIRVLDKGEANTATFNLIDFAEEAVRVTQGNGVIFCGKEQFSPLYEYFDDAGLTTRMIIWEKTNPMPLNGQHVFLSGVECAVHFRKKGATFNGHCMNTVFRCPNGSSKRHPTEKPVKLWAQFVVLLSNQGDLVLDPCVGSGTTAFVCQETNRDYICGDINNDYVAMTIRRLCERSQECS